SNWPPLPDCMEGPSPGFSSDVGVPTGQPAGTRPGVRSAVALLRVRVYVTSSHAGKGTYRLPGASRRFGNGRAVGERCPRGVGGEREGRVRSRVDARIARARPGGRAERPAPSVQVHGGRGPGRR